jgi:CBS domain-containing protein
MPINATGVPGGGRSFLSADQRITGWSRPSKRPTLVPMRIQDVMTKSPRTCRPGESANEAARIMWESDCGVVPIVDPENRVVGIVTDRDICMAAYFQGRPLSQISLESIMSSDVCTCRESAELQEAERVMQTHQVHRIPVVDGDNRLAGMLSLSDVVRGTTRGGGLKRASGDAGQLLATVAAISQPRQQAMRAN